MESYQLNDQSCELLTEQPVLATQLLSCPDQVCYGVTYETKTLRATNSKNGKETVWHLSMQSDQLRLQWIDFSSVQPEVTELLAAVEAAFANYPHQKKLYLAVSSKQFTELFDSGVLVRDEDNQCIVYAELFWQQARVWRSSIRHQIFPIHYIFSHGSRHPLRPPKPQGIVYRRCITWLDGTLTFRAINPIIHERLTRSLVISIGGQPRIPDCFSSLRRDARVFHSNSYLNEIKQHGHAGKIAVVGGRQSASEIFMDLHQRSSTTQVDLIMRARSIKPSDDSPFVNEIFNTDFTDYVFNSPEQERSKILDEFWHTNYAAPDLVLIEQIFNVLYQQKVSGIERHRFLRRHEVRKATAQHKGIQFTLHDLNTDSERTVTYDAVVLATGYHRDHYKSLLAPLTPYFEDLTVDRQYRVCSTPHFKPAVFLQGACESSHGLSDTLLSVTAVRTSEIAQALVNTLNQSKGIQAKRKMSSALV